MSCFRTLLLVVLPLAFPGIGRACGCLPAPLQAMVESSDIVFRGKLVAHRGNAAVFRVQELWKGSLRTYIEVEWHRERADCNGFWPHDLKVGNKLLVFADKGSDGVYRTRICLPTGKVADKQDELQHLGPGKPPLEKKEAGH